MQRRLRRRRGRRSWPTARRPSATASIVALFASATRDDGDDQVTVDGWPLYFFSGDAAPGDTNGQGVGGIWYVVGPDGAAIGADE